MPEPQILAAIFAVGLASYTMRAGGFVAARTIPQDGLLTRLLRLAPGNLFIAFAATGVLSGGWPSFAGCVAAIATMAITKREWAALAAGFGAAAMVSFIT